MNYIRSAKSIGSPHTDAVCGREGIELPGLIWLIESESGVYDNEQRDFGFNNASMKVKSV